MRRSVKVTLTVLPILAATAVATAQPSERLSPPGLTAPIAVELSPPGRTATIYEIPCSEDPARELRTDCSSHATVIRGGFGHYFHAGGG